MESGALGMNVSTAPDPRVQPDCNVACLRRRAWAQSRDSVWQEPEPEPERCDPQGPQPNQRDREMQRPSEEPGQVPNKITSWLIECRTPIGASLDDQSASPNRGALRNGCSFEDDLSLGAEANHLQSANNKPESCFGLAADQRRNRYKEKGRSMNSTGSGKSSTVSSVSEFLKLSEEHPVEIPLTLRVSELLDLYEEDPEEVLFNLGFGREEPDIASRVPARFINNTSSARGIDIKVYLKAQLQRVELENPNYALTSRFRQIEVLTTVANEFFQLYSQVSGQPVKRISTKDQGGENGEGGENESSPPPLKRSSSALNVAKLLKKTITRHNLNVAASASAEAHTPNQHTQLNGHAPSDHTNTNGHAHAGPEQDSCSTDPDHQAEAVNQKHNRKKDSCSLATVTEENNGDGETDSPEQNVPAVNGEHQPGSADVQSANQRTNEEAQVVKEEREEEENLTSTPEKALPNLAPPQLAQLRTENTDSFDMEEIQSNEDEALPHRTSRAADLLRTVSQHSDSSGFAEEPSADSNSYLKVQESSDSCDSETTVTSHPSQDVVTPLAVDQPAFDLPDGIKEEVGPDGAEEADGRRSSREEHENDGSLEQVPQYTAHQLPRNEPMGMQQEVTQDEERVDQMNPEPEPEISQSLSAAEQEPQSELEHNQIQSASVQELQHTQNLSETAAATEPTTDAVEAEDEAREEHVFTEDSGLLSPTVPSSPVLSALKRARQNRLSRAGPQVDPQSVNTSQTPGRGRGRGRGRGGIPLQRSSSLPSSFLSPSRVVSTVRIQFGRGSASCTQPRFSFKYTQEDGEDKTEEEEEEVDGQTNCLSTLIINPASSTDSNNRPRPLAEAPIPPKPIPRYLMRSSYSLQSSSPPPDWSSEGHAHSWSTQSVPNLCSGQQQQMGHFQQNMSANQNQQSWNSGQMMFPIPSPSPNPSTQYLNPSPCPSPIRNPSPYPFTLNPSPQYPSPLQPYASLPNLLHHNPSLIHHSSLSSLYQPTASAIPHHGSLSSLHQPSASTAPHHASLGSLHPGTPMMHHQGYNNPYNYPSPYHTSPHGSQFASPFPGFHGYNMNPHQTFHQPVPQFTPLAPEHSLHPGLAQSAQGFHPGLASTHGQSYSLHPGLTPPAPSSTEMQLRKVLHEIRGMVQSLSQKRTDTPDSLNENRGALTSHPSLAEFQQKRRSLNLFRNQMMDLELSIMRQQALVYKHLSPADRLEMEQLQSLRSAVREELQELEQQLEDRLMELAHYTQYRGLRRDSDDSLATDPALRAMEPVSDLLREQLLLQSEISYDGHAPSTNPSSRSSSPVQGGGGNSEQGRGVYRASINITPQPPPRPNTQKEENGEEEGEKDRGGGGDGGGGGGGGGGGEIPGLVGATGGVRVQDLQQLIKEIRESVAQEVRREIYSELLATLSPRRSPLPTRQHPL